MIVGAGLALSGSALAVDVHAAGKAKCGACHAVDKKVVSPEFVEV